MTAGNLHPFRDVLGQASRGLTGGFLLLRIFSVALTVGNLHPFRDVLGQASRGLTGGFLLLRIFSVAISVSPHVFFSLDIILISMFLK